MCASEAFTYMTRWVPVPERRSRPRPRPSAAEVEIYERMVNRASEPPRRRSLFAQAALGLTAASVLGIFWGGQKARQTGAAVEHDIERESEPGDEP